MVRNLDADITIAEAQAEIDALAKEIGPRADLHLSLSPTRQYSKKEEAPIYFAVYADGMVGQGPTFSFYAASLREAISVARAKWEEFRETHAARTISAMALEIIRLTDENGEATDAGLRAACFDGDVVARYGKRAAERATEMAGRGPFVLKTLGGDNGAPAEDEEA